MAMLLVEKLSTTKERFKHSERPARVPAPGVDVWYSIGLEQKQVRIKNISPTGVYLLTGDRWPQGSSVLLTMKSSVDPRNQVSIPARIVRHDSEGVGMEFLHKGVSTAEWLALFSSAVSLTPENDPVRVFRAAKALAFMARITSFAEGQVLELLTRAMNPERIEKAVGVVLTAEALLESQQLTPRTDVSSTLIREILEEGSGNRDELAQRYWAGMLASASLDCPDSDISRAFATLLSELAPIHIRILDAAGFRAIRAGWKSELALEERFWCSTEEIKKITDTEHLAEIECALDYLDALGLMHMTLRVFGFVGANLTPTRLGLNLYGRCSGETDLRNTIRSAELQTGSRSTPFDLGVTAAKKRWRICCTG